MSIGRKHSIAVIALCLVAFITASCGKRPDGDQSGEANSITISASSQGPDFIAPGTFRAGPVIEFICEQPNGLTYDGRGLLVRKLEGDFFATTVAHVAKVITSCGGKLRVQASAECAFDLVAPPKQASNSLSDFPFDIAAMKLRLQKNHNCDIRIGHLLWDDIPDENAPLQIRLSGVDDDIDLDRVSSPGSLALFVRNNRGLFRQTDSGTPITIRLKGGIRYIGFASERVPTISDSSNIGIDRLLIQRPSDLRFMRNSQSIEDFFKFIPLSTRGAKFLHSIGEDCLSVRDSVRLATEFADMDVFDQVRSFLTIVNRCPSVETYVLDRDRPAIHSDGKKIYLPQFFNNKFALKHGPLLDNCEIAASLDGADKGVLRNKQIISQLYAMALLRLETDADAGRSYFAERMYSRASCQLRTAVLANQPSEPLSTILFGFRKLGVEEQAALVVKVAGLIDEASSRQFLTPDSRFRYRAISLRLYDICHRFTEFANKKCDSNSVVEAAWKLGQALGGSQNVRTNYSVTKLVRNPNRPKISTNCFLVNLADDPDWTNAYYYSETDETFLQGIEQEFNLKTAQGAYGKYRSLTVDKNGHSLCT